MNPDLPRPHSEGSTPSKAALLIGLQEQPQNELQRILGDEKWTVHVAYALGSALRLLTKQPVAIVVSARNLPLGDWRSVLEAIQELPDPPLFIVTHRSGDNHLGAEALNLGAFDVLAEPFQAPEVVHVLHSAWHRWTNRGQHRHLGGKAKHSGRS
jgi:DNA-binding response OmpR family regulator